MIDPVDVAAVGGRILDEVERAVVGKRDALELVLAGWLADGHVLIEDVPGLAKTLLARSFASSTGLDLARVQFTPDLMPSDVTGSSVWDPARARFVFHPGPVFTNLLLGDEINRAPPKTQAALLEAMAERQVTTDGETRPLPQPFLVLATQNPIEFEGTYPLPESQLDRFLLRISIGYPDPAAELDIIETHGRGGPLDDLAPVASADDVRALIAIARDVHVSGEVRQYLVALAAASRRHPALALGMSPRATLGWLRVSRALAAAEGRDHVTPDDLKSLAHPVLGHRLMLTPEAQLQGRSTDDAVDDVLRSVAVPGRATG